MKNGKRTCLAAMVLVAQCTPFLSPAWAQSLGPEIGPSDYAGDAVLSTAREWGGAKDGVYTCDEWKRYLARMYNLADGKRRGFIDVKDFDVIKRASKVFAKADFDYFDVAGKGKISRQDFIAQPSPFFARFDKKAVCRVSDADIKQGLADETSTKAQVGSGGRRRGGGGG
ncbi:MAG: hypothetical protein JWL62_3891, partial [Hyphomicrobiales bacterium]|nr:hypothetical protein [Hyphomicrobiales bacterium]